MFDASHDQSAMNAQGSSSNTLVGDAVGRALSKVNTPSTCCIMLKSVSCLPNLLVAEAYRVPSSYFQRIS